MSSPSSHDDDIPPLLTIAEIAKRFELPESTARYYCKRFMDYLPHVGDGKRRRYKPETLDIFAVILEEMKKHKDSKPVEVVLARQFARNVEGREPKAAPPAAQAPAAMDSAPLQRFLDNQNRFMERLADAMEQLASRDRSIDELKDEIAERDLAIAALRKEMESIKSYQFEAERIHQQDLEQLRKWLNHLASRQSGES